MNVETIKLCGEDERASLTTFVPCTRKEKSDAILIIPGGGYSGVCSDREGENIAIAFNALGYACFVLDYSVKPNAVFPRPLIEASLAMKHIKENAEKYKVDPERVFVLGFSAGGHLAGSLGTRWHIPEVAGAIDAPFGTNKPRGMILCYPVLCWFDKTHKGTFYNAFGTETPTDEQVKLISLENDIGENTAPAFLWHTANDNAVNVQNTLKMATALSEAKVPFEVHIFPNGPHGMALGTPDTGATPAMIDARVAEWPRLADGWMKSI
jgi:acetyl esterase/lipase